MKEEEIRVLIGRLHTFLVQGRCEEFAMLFAEGGVYDHTTRGRELEASGGVTGMPRIAEAAAKWLSFTTNRELVSQSYFVHPDLPGPEELRGIPPVKHLVVADFTFRAHLADGSGGVVVIVRNLVCLTASGRIARLQSDEAITRA